MVEPLQVRSRKYRIVTAVERLNNRLTRFVLRKGVAPPASALLEPTGRRTGIPRHTPVGNGCIGDTFWLVAAHGTQADYVRNLQVLPSRSLTLLWCSILVAEAVFGWVRYPAGGAAAVRDDPAPRCHTSGR